MDIEGMKQTIDEALKPLLDRIATLEQKSDALEISLNEGRKATALENFASKLKPGYQEKAAELYEAYQKDPAAWVIENSDKFVRTRQSRQMGGLPIVDGGQAFDLAKEQDKLWGRST